MMRKRGRLARRLTLIFMIIAILPLVFGSSLSIYSGFQFGREEISLHQSSVVFLANSYIDSYLANISSDLKLIGEVNLTKDAGLSLESICLNSPGLYAELAILDSQGQELNHLFDCQTKKEKIINPAILESFINAKTNELFVGDISLEAGKPLVTVSRPVKLKNRGEVIAIAVVNLDYLWRSLCLLQPGQGSYFYLVDREKNLIKCQDENSSDRQINVAALPVIFSPIDRRQGIVAQRYVGLLGVEVIGTSKVVKNTNWVIVLEQPASLALAAPNRLISHLAALIAIVSFLAAMAAIILAQYIVRPLNLLARGAEEIAAGDLTYAIEIESNDEIGILARAFNQMTKQLKSSRQRLEDYNHTLEQRVERRTDELIKSQQKLTLMFEQTPLAVIEWNNNFEVTAWNPAAEAIFGYSKDEAIERHALGLIVPPEEAEKVAQIWQELLAGTGGTRSTNENITKDGRKIICDWYNTVLIDREGNAIGVASMALDITDRKQAEEELKLSKEYLRLIIDNIPQQVFWKDTNLVFQGCNKNWAISAHLESPEAVVGKTDYDLLNNRELAELFRAQDRRIMETDTPQLHIIATKEKPSAEGEKIWLDINKIPIHDSTGKVIGIVGVLEDITARKAAEEALREREEQYHSIFEATTDGLIINNFEGFIVEANPAAHKMYGYEYHEFIGLHGSKFIHPDDHQRAAEDLQNIFANGGRFSAQGCHVRKDGSEFPIEVHAMSFIYKGKPHMMSVIRDITDRKQAEEALRAEKEKSERLLLNILPEAIADRLKEDRGYIADSFLEVTVLFADIVGFTALSTRLSPTQLVEILNVIFSEFDRLAEKHGLEKIKTIGDAYMVVGGLPKPRADHAEAIAKMALDMQKEIAQFNASTGEAFSIRIGINSGPVVAGVIGIKKFIYDLWGDTVNTASRMESHGIPGCIQVTDVTYKLLQDKFLFEQRGRIPIKGKGLMATYFLTGINELSNRELPIERH